MIASLEDVVPFFMFWKNERTRVHAMISAPGLRLLGVGYITECADEGFRYCHAGGDFTLEVDFGEVRQAAFMTPGDFHGGRVRKGGEDIPLEHGWILHTASGALMNFFEASDSPERPAG
jgi:hypothetical protein